MKASEIEKYEYCKEYLKCINEWKGKLPFGIQKYGCGAGSPSIEFEIEDIHRDMFKEVRHTMDKAIKQVQSIVDSI